jgi:alanine-glyoxylate transaminase / serine-glyoxylate transaminase / serine-pyruvate transaminase
MAMADLGFPIRLGAGVAAAQDYYRSTTTAAATHEPALAKTA